MDEKLTCKDCKRYRIIYAKLVCKSCYNKKYRDKERQREYDIRWKGKNPDYFKNYYLIHRQLKVMEIGQ